MGELTTLLLQALDGGPLGRNDRASLGRQVRLLEDAMAASLATTKLGATASADFRRVTITGDLAVPAGRITVGPLVAGKSNILLSAGALQLRNYLAVTIDLQSDGDVFIGSDTSAPGSTYVSIFSTTQSYNGETITAGNMLLGDNSAGKANILWDKSTGRLNFRGGTSAQAYVDTTGAIVAGAGNLTLDATGLWFVQGGFGQNSVRWTAGGSTVATLNSTYVSPLQDTEFQTVGLAATDQLITIISVQPAGSVGHGALIKLADDGTGLATTKQYVRIIIGTTTITDTNSGGLTVTGTLRTTVDVRPGDANSWLKNYTVSLAINTSGQLLSDEAAPLGFVWIVNVTENGFGALFFLTGGSHVAQELLDPSGVFSAASGTLTSTNVYWNAAGHYDIENRRGGTVVYRILYFGV